MSTLELRAWAARIRFAALRTDLDGLRRLRALRF